MEVTLFYWPDIERTCKQMTDDWRVCLAFLLQYPERVYETQAGVLSVDFSQSHPSLLAVSLLLSISMLTHTHTQTRMHTHMHVRTYTPVLYSNEVKVMRYST